MKLDDYKSYQNIIDAMIEALSEDIVAQYLTAPETNYLGIYHDNEKFVFKVGTSIGEEIDIFDKPISTIPCPGVDNLDPDDFFITGIDYVQTEEELARKKCLIIKHCHEDDINDFKEEIVERLFDRPIREW